MGIRDNLVISYARMDLAVTVAQQSLRQVSTKLTHAERQRARIASANAMVRWFDDGCPEAGPDVTRVDIDHAVEVMASLGYSGDVD